MAESEAAALASVKMKRPTVTIGSDGEGGLYVGQTADGKVPHSSQISKMKNLVETMNTKANTRATLQAKLLDKKVKAFLEDPSPEALTDASALTAKIMPWEKNPTNAFLRMVKGYGLSLGLGEVEKSEE